MGSQAAEDTISMSLAYNDKPDLDGVTFQLSSPGQCSILPLFPVLLEVD